MQEHLQFMSLHSCKKKVDFSIKITNKMSHLAKTSYADREMRWVTDLDKSDVQQQHITSAATWFVCFFCSPSPNYTLGLSTWDRRSRSDADRGSKSKDHFASTRPRSGSELPAVLRNSAWDPVQQCNACSLCAMWSSLESTLSPNVIQWIWFQSLWLKFTYIQSNFHF